MQDGCFAVWQRMVAADIGSDEITQRLLAMAFGSNPQLANALVHEAKLMQASPEPGCKVTDSASCCPDMHVMGSVTST